MGWDGAAFDKKGSSSENHFIRTLLPNFIGGPVLDVHISLQKDNVAAASILDYYFPDTDDFLTSRKQYRVSTCFIPDSWIHPKGGTWCDVIRNKAHKHISELSDIDRILFPNGVQYVDFTYDNNMSGIFSDVVYCFFLAQIAADDAKRHEIIGSVAASGLANFKHSFDRKFDFNDLSDLPGHFHNYLSPKVLFGFFSFVCVFFGFLG